MSDGVTAKPPKRNKIAIIGYGAMGEALARGIHIRYPEIAIAVSDTSQSRQTLAKEAGFSVIESDAGLPDALTNSDIVILALKPQAYPQFERAIGELGISVSGGLVSIMAGIPLERLLSITDEKKLAARCMPNLAVSVGKASIGVCYSESFFESLGASDRQRSIRDTRDDIETLLGSVGSVYHLPEPLFGALIGVSGSAIAFVFQFAHALAMGGVRCGMPYKQAIAIATETLQAAAALLKEQNAAGKSPTELITRVSSPAGTTIEGLAALSSGGFDHAVMDAVFRAARRADELNREYSF